MELRNVTSAGSEIRVFGNGNLTIDSTCTNATVYHSAGIQVDDQSSSGVTVVLVESDPNWMTADRPSPGQGDLPASAPFPVKVDHLYKGRRNIKRQDANTGVLEVLNDDDATVDHKSAVTDAAGITTVGRFVSGP
jgi:hypothetical protein